MEQERGAYRQVFGGRRVDHSFNPYFVVGCVGGVNVALGFPRRFLGNEMEESAGRVSPEQGSLRPAQYLDPFQVVQGEIQPRGRQHVEFVDIADDRGFVAVAEIAQTDTPDKSIGVGAPPLCREVIHAWNLGDHVGAGYQAEIPDLLTAQRGDRNADVLQALLSFLCCDDDFFENRSGIYRNKNYG